MTMSIESWREVLKRLGLRWKRIALPRPIHRHRRLQNETLESRELLAGIISITSSDTDASEYLTDPAVFTLSRTGDVNGSESVYLSYGSSASSSDYQSLPSYVTFSPGSTNATFTLIPVDDNYVEGDESLTISISASSIGTSMVSLTIHDDDVNVQVVATDPNASETGPMSGSFRIERQGAIANSLSVNFWLGGSASVGTDYTPTASNSVTIPAGSTSTTVTIAPYDDSLVENTESVTLNLSGGTGYSLSGSSTASLNIQDNDSASSSLPTIQAYAIDSMASENGDSGQFFIYRSGETSQTLSVSFLLSGTATQGMDYSYIGSSTTIPAGISSTTVTLYPIDDLDTEGSEYASLYLLYSSNYQFGSSSSGTVTITDNDAGSTSISVIATGTPAESGPTSGSFILQRTGSTANSVSVNFGIGGTATMGTDYGTVSTSMIIPAGASSATVTIAPYDDSLVEGSENVTLSLSSGSGYALSGSTFATLEILDRVMVDVYASDGWATEGGADWGEFVIHRSAGFEQSLPVYFWMGGTASNSVDYQSQSYGITIPAGASSATVSLIPLDDWFVEGNEIAEIHLSGSPGYSVSYNSSYASVTIADNDSISNVWVSASNSQAAEQGSAPGSFVISRDGNFGASLNVYFYYSGTALSSDYSAPYSVNIPVGASSATVSITPVDDSLVEGPETVDINLSWNTGYQIPYLSSASLTILDNDTSSASVYIVAERDANEEGLASGQFTIYRSGETATDLLVYYNIAGGYFNGYPSATAVDDFTQLPGSITIPAGSNSASITIAPVDDSQVEGSEGVNLYLSYSSSYSISYPSSAATIFIEDNDVAVGIYAQDAYGAEQGNDVASVVIYRTGGSTSESLNVSYTLGGTAINNRDYLPLSGTATIPAGETATVVNIIPYDDLETEGSESVGFTLEPGTGYEISSSSSAQVTISDNDYDDSTSATIGIYVSDATIDEGSEIAEVTVFRTGSTSDKLVVWMYVGGTATPYQDYAGLGWQVTIPIGETAATIDVIPYDDSKLENDETVTFQLLNYSGSAAVTIVDDDRPEITVTASDPIGREIGADPAEFTIARTGGSGGVTVYFTLAGSATEGSDYASVVTSVYLEPGIDSTVISLSPINDTADEGDEDVRLQLSSSAGYKIGSSSAATVVIEDDDLLRNRVSFWAQNSYVGETWGSGSFVVQRTGSTSSALTVQLSWSGTAVGGWDFQSLPTSVTIPAGQNQATITVTPIDDQVEEGTETIGLTLEPGSDYLVETSSASSNYYGSFSSPGTITIVDDDFGTNAVANVTVQATDDQGSETAFDPISFVISRSGGDSGVDLVVDFTWGGTAGAADYDTVYSNSVLIPAHESSVEVTIVPFDDIEFEMPETVVLQLSAYPGSASASIADNDLTAIASVFSIKPGDLQEPGVLADGSYRLRFDPQASTAFTWNPVVVARLDMAAAVQAGRDISVEFDQFGDGTWDGVVYPDSNGDIRYDLRDWGLADDFVGMIPLRYRVVEMDKATGRDASGPWQTWSFERIAAPELVVSVIPSSEEGEGESPLQGGMALSMTEGEQNSVRFSLNSNFSAMALYTDIAVTVHFDTGAGNQLSTNDFMWRYVAGNNSTWAYPWLGGYHGELIFVFSNGQLFRDVEFSALDNDGPEVVETADIYTLEGDQRYSVLNLTIEDPTLQNTLGDPTLVGISGPTSIMETQYADFSLIRTGDDTQELLVTVHAEPDPSHGATSDDFDRIEFTSFSPLSTRNLDPSEIVALFSFTGLGLSLPANSNSVRLRFYAKKNVDTATNNDPSTYNENVTISIVDTSTYDLLPAHSSIELTVTELQSTLPVVSVVNTDLTSNQTGPYPRAATPEGNSVGFQVQRTMIGQSDALYVELTITGDTLDADNDDFVLKDGLGNLLSKGSHGGWIVEIPSNNLYRSLVFHAQKDDKFEALETFTISVIEEPTKFTKGASAISEIVDKTSQLTLVIKANQLDFNDETEVVIANRNPTIGFTDGEQIPLTLSAGWLASELVSSNSVAIAPGSAQPKFTVVGTPNTVSFKVKNLNQQVRSPRDIVFTLSPPAGSADLAPINKTLTLLTSPAEIKRFYTSGTNLVIDYTVPQSLLASNAASLSFIVYANTVGTGVSQQLFEQVEIQRAEWGESDLGTILTYSFTPKYAAAMAGKDSQEDYYLSVGFVGESFSTIPEKLFEGGYFTIPAANERHYQGRYSSNVNDQSADDVSLEWLVSFNPALSRFDVTGNSIIDSVDREFIKNYPGDDVPNPWHNSSSPGDVNRDQSIDIRDLLQFIFVWQRGERTLETVTDPGSLALDLSGDFGISAIDLRMAFTYFVNPIATQTSSALNLDVNQNGSVDAASDLLAFDSEITAKNAVDGKWKYRVRTHGGNDRVTASPEMRIPAFVLGGEGDDVFHGGAGDDHLDGGAGRDVIFGENGDDYVFAGIDIVPKDDKLRGGWGVDTVVGHKSDTITAETPIAEEDKFTYLGFQTALDGETYIEIDLSKNDVIDGMVNASNGTSQSPAVGYKWVITTPPTKGDLNSFESQNGKFIYYGDQGFFGEDSFTYEVQAIRELGNVPPIANFIKKVDGAESAIIVGENSNRTKVTIKALNDQPIAIDTEENVIEDTPKIINLIAVDDTTDLRFQLLDFHESMAFVGMFFDGDIEDGELPLDYGSPELENAYVTFVPSLDLYTYAGAGEHDWPIELKFAAIDGSEISSTATVSIAIEAANDPPTIGSPFPYTSGGQTYSYFEGDEDDEIQLINLGGVGITVDDVEKSLLPPEAITTTADVEVKVSEVNGKLKLSSFGGPPLTITTGDGGSYTAGEISPKGLVLKGPYSDVNEALSHLVFIPRENFNDADEREAYVTVQANDLGNFPAPEMTAERKFLISVIPINDAPTVTLPEDLEVRYGTELKLSGVGVSDVDVDKKDHSNTGIEFVVTISVVEGSLRFERGDKDKPNEIWKSKTLTGDLTYINYWLKKLVYVAPACGGPYRDTLSVSANDQGNTGEGSAKTTTKTTPIKIFDRAVVGITATDPWGYEGDEEGIPNPPDLAEFTVTRSYCNLSLSNPALAQELVVTYEVFSDRPVEDKAIEGDDYVSLPNQYKVTIPANKMSAEIDITPIYDTEKEGAQYVDVRIVGYKAISGSPGTTSPGSGSTVTTSSTTGSTTSSGSPGDCPSDSGSGSTTSTTPPPTSCYIDTGYDRDYYHSQAYVGIDDGPPPVVTLTAVDAYATEDLKMGGIVGDDGEIVIARNEGRKAGSINVFLVIDPDSTAELGTDFEANGIIPSSYFLPATSPYYGEILYETTIPDKSSSRSIFINPLGDKVNEWDKFVKFVMVDDVRLLPIDYIPPVGASIRTKSPVGYKLGNSTEGKVTILDDDSVSGLLQRNIDVVSTGLQRAFVGDEIPVDVFQGLPDYSVIMPNGLALSYHGDTNSFPILPVEWQWPDQKRPSELVVKTIFAGGPAGIQNASHEPVLTRTNTVYLEDVAADQPFRLNLLTSAEIAEELPTGHYDYDLIFTANYEGQEFTRTIRGSTEVISSKTFGAGWGLDELDRLVPSDGLTLPNTDKGRLAIPGSALIRGDGSSGFFVSQPQEGIISSLPTLSSNEVYVLGQGNINVSDWKQGTYRGGVGNDYFYTTQYEATANWSLTSLNLEAHKQYQVYVSWIPGTNRDPQAKYELLGLTKVGTAPTSAESPLTIEVDQRYVPGEQFSDNVYWRSLGFFTRTGDEPSIKLIASGYGETVADAVMLESDWKYATPDGTASELKDRIDDLTTIKSQSASTTPVDGRTPNFQYKDKYQTTYQFDSQGLLIRVRDRNQNQTQYKYTNGSGDANKLLQIVRQGNLVTTFAYDSGLVSIYDSSINDPNARATTLTIVGDSLTQLQLPDPGYGQPVASYGFGYDTQQLQSVTDPRGNTTTLQYSNHRVKSGSYANGTSFQLTSYLADGLVEDQIVPRKRATGKIGLSDSDSSSQALSNSFVEMRAQYSDAKAISEATKDVWYYQTDSFGLVTAEARPWTKGIILRPNARKENVWTWLRDQNGLVTTATEPSGEYAYFAGTSYAQADFIGTIITKFEYDPSLPTLNLVKITNPDGSQETWEYSKEGQVKLHVLKSIREYYGTENKLSSLGNVDSKEEYVSSTQKRITSFTYTPPPIDIAMLPGGLLHTETLAGQVTTYEYYQDADRMGLLAFTRRGSINDPVLTTFDYDGNRNISSFQNELEKTTTYVFDKLNRLVTTTLPAPGFGQAAGAPLLNSYNALGQLITETTATGYTITREYDNRNRLSTESRPAATGVDGGLAVWQVEFKYDANGNPKEQIDPHGTTTYTYDGRNQLVETLAPIVTGLPSADGFSVPSSASVRPKTIYGYDNLGHLIALSDPRNISVGTDSGFPDVVHQRFAYDKMGNQTWTGVWTGALLTQSAQIFNLLGEATILWTIDPTSDSRLIISARLAYDGLGRLKTETQPTGGGLVKVTTYNDRDQVLSTSVRGDFDLKTEMKYDALGNLTVINAPGAGTSGARMITLAAYDKAGNQLRELSFENQSVIVSPAQTIDTVDTFLTNQLLASNKPYRSTNIVYDDWGRPVVTVGTDPDGNLEANSSITTTTLYGPDNQVRSVTAESEGENAVFLRTMYDYDSAGYLKSVKDRFDSTREGREWRTTETSYYPDGTVKLVRQNAMDPLQPDSTIQYAYDSLGRLSTTTDAAGLVTRSYFDAVGNPALVINGAGVPTYYEFNRLNQNIEVKSPIVSANSNGSMGNWNTYQKTEYYNSGLVKRQYTIGDDATKLDVTMFTYDSAGRIETRTISNGPNSATTNYKANSFGNLVELVDASGNKTSYQYDPRGNQTRETEVGTGLSRTMNYDAFGGRLSTTDRNGRVVKYTNNNLGLPVSETWYSSTIDNTPDFTAAYQYGDDGQLLTASQSQDRTVAGGTINNAITTNYDYSPDRQVIGVNHDLPSFLGGGRISIVAPPNFDGTPSKRELKGKLGTEVTETFTYNAGRPDSITSTTYAGGIRTSTADVDYNAKGQLDEIVTTFDWDVANDPNDPNGQSRFDSVSRKYQYQADGRLNNITYSGTSAYEPGSYGSPSKTLFYEDVKYNKVGLVSDTNYFKAPAGAYSVPVPFQEKTSGYDDKGQLTSVTGTVSESITYDSNGNKNATKIDPYNRLRDTELTHYDYDGEGNVIRKIALNSTPLGDQLAGEVYSGSTDAATGVSKYLATQVNASELSLSGEYRFELEGGFIGLNLSNSALLNAAYQSITKVELWLGTGNDLVVQIGEAKSLQLTINNHVIPTLAFTHHFAENVTGRLVLRIFSTQPIPQGYSAIVVGGTIKYRGVVSSQSYVWDHHNRLLQVQRTNSTGVASTADYFYNTLGELIAKDVTPSPSIGDGIEVYLNDGGKQLAVFDTAGRLRNHQLYAANIDHLLAVDSFEYNGSSGAPISRNTVWPVADHQGSVYGVAQGDDLQTFTQGSFGLPSDSAGPGGQIDELYEMIRGRYLGWEFDANAGLYLRGGRPYDPATGRFLTEQATPPGANPYVHNDNSPGNNRAINSKYNGAVLDSPNLGLIDSIMSWQLRDNPAATEAIAGITDGQMSAGVGVVAVAGGLASIPLGISSAIVGIGGVVLAGIGGSSLLETGVEGGLATYTGQDYNWSAGLAKNAAVNTATFGVGNKLKYGGKAAQYLTSLGIRTAGDTAIDVGVYGRDPMSSLLQNAAGNVVGDGVGQGLGWVGGKVWGRAAQFNGLTDAATNQGKVVGAFKIDLVNPPPSGWRYWATPYTPKFVNPRIVDPLTGIKVPTSSLGSKVNLHELQHFIDATTHPQLYYFARASTAPGAGLAHFIYETRGYLQSHGIKALFQPSLAMASVRHAGRSSLVYRDVAGLAGLAGIGGFTYFVGTHGGVQQ